MDFPYPCLMFLADVDRVSAKTALGVAHWRPDACVGQLRLPGGEVDLGLPDMSPRAAKAAGARSLLIGVANAGGFIPPRWEAVLIEALEAGLDLVSGLHTRLASLPRVRETADRLGRRLFEAREADPRFSVVGEGAKRGGRRLLTVGTDCAVGKMYAALALTKELKARGVDADFRATGQTGIFIAGSGAPIDAIVSDFVAGAAEVLSPPAADDHWDIIEGQGSLFHPAYAGVTLGLLHGSQPDALVLCHDATRTTIDGLETFPTPSLAEAAELNLRLARLTNSDVRLAGVCVNTSRLSPEAAAAYMRGVTAELGVPCCDPVRAGVAAIVDGIVEDIARRGAA
ncbi:DUF1611 domain-containing protein [Caulobacter segnis]|uniref:DUF1611 domain-containing protein n=1 Tax=Caulobacter segnis TaxID=88688 RepID=UPI002857606E|nr:DUF1611 domain-containing protein [Caulobacter segnis]MDR6625852.1 putative NAD-dependent epimerase/dehydratase family protein [Caulobacter segnis]